MAVVRKQGERPGCRGRQPRQRGQHRGARVLAREGDGAEDFLERVPGSPAQIAASAAATAAVSCGPKAPRSNRAPAIGCASTAKATAAGSARPSAISNPRDCAAVPLSWLRVLVFASFYRRAQRGDDRCARHPHPDQART